jgi:hypothetical protein
MQDWTLLLRELSGSFNMSQQGFGMSQEHARWAPHNLSNEQCASLLMKFCLVEQISDFSPSIITCYESWTWHYEPEMKQRSSVRKHKALPAPKKFRTITNVWKSDSIFLLPQEQTVNDVYYADISESYL